MWRTPCGERVLGAAEWALFREGLDSLWGWVEESWDDPDIFATGVEAFDGLEVGSKLALMALVGTALSDEGTPRPELTINNEGTVAAVFRQIACQVALEIEVSRDPKRVSNRDEPEQRMYWRRLVLAAYRETALQDAAAARAMTGSEVGGGRKSEELPDDEDDHWSPPEAVSDDEEEWEFLVESLANRILWNDGDYEAGDEFLDADPAEARIRKEMMGIPQDYYSDIPPDPTEEQLESIRLTLGALCGQPEPKESELIDGIEDLHHGLLVGPCDAQAIADETACRLVEPIQVLEDDLFDCSHAEWAQIFREEVHRVASAESKVPEIIFSKQQGMDAARARESGGPVMLDDDHRVEPREGAWVVINRHGDFLADIEECIWNGRESDHAMPPLKFPTPEEALVGYLRSTILATARSERYEAALRQLGREG